jgi:hypothetical protein
MAAWCGPQDGNTLNSGAPARKGASMEMKLGLNVVATITSFGFLAAIVFGMI